MKFKLARNLLAILLTWLIGIPILVLDIMLELYHHLVFPLCGIPLVKRSNYIRIDRQKLSYLTFTDKIACAYCGYANGFAAYFVRIAGDTEKYWCAIKHSEGNGSVPQPHQKDFLPYGDEQAYKEFISKK